MPLNVNATLVCDDFRTEDNGKVMLIGIYTPNIVVPTLPAILPTLCIFQVLESDGPMGVQVRVRLTHPDSRTTIGEGMFDAHFEGPRLGYTTVRFVGVPLPAHGRYEVMTLVQDLPVSRPYSFSVVAPS